MLKEIAVANMVRLGMLPKCIYSFRENPDHLWASETRLIRVDGVLTKKTVLVDTMSKSYAFRKEVEKALKIVRDAGFVPYHVLQALDRFGGSTITVLYVGNEDGEISEEDFLGESFGFCVPSYALVSSDSHQSDFGDISIKGMNGGVIRTV